MKRILFVLLLSMFALSTASAAFLGNCADSYTLDQLIGNSCQSNDKLFSNFTYGPSTSDPATNVRASLVLHEGPPDTHGWIFDRVAGDPWNFNFSLSFQVNVCQNSALCPASFVPNSVIFASKDQLNTGPVPNGVAGNDVQNGSGGQSHTINTNGLAVGNETQQQNWSPAVTQIATTTQISILPGSELLSYEQDFFQTQVPEPATVLLIGAGLVCVSLLRRRRA